MIQYEKQLDRKFQLTETDLNIFDCFAHLLVLSRHGRTTTVRDKFTNDLLQQAHVWSPLSNAALANRQSGLVH
jgi:hypothetical protein